MLLFHFMPLGKWPSTYCQFAPLTKACRAVLAWRMMRQVEESSARATAERTRATKSAFMPQPSFWREHSWCARGQMLAPPSWRFAADVYPRERLRGPTLRPDQELQRRDSSLPCAQLTAKP